MEDIYEKVVRKFIQLQYIVLANAVKLYQLYIDVNSTILSAWKRNRYKLKMIRLVETRPSDSTDRGALSQVKTV